MGLLALVTVAVFDIVTSPAPSRATLLALHLLFFLCYILPDLIHLLWRRSINGHLVLSVFVAIQLLMVAAGSDVTAQIVILFVMSAYAHESLDGLAAYLWVVGFGVASMFGFSYLWQNAAMGTLVGIGTLGGYLFVGSAARNRRAAEAARAESQRLLQELQIAHEQLKRHAHKAEELAAAEERNRLARELHDTLGHRLTVAAVQLEGAQRLMSRDPDRATQMVEVVRKQVLEGLTELRQTVAALRTPAESDLALPAAVERLAQQHAAATALRIQVEIDEQVRPYLDGLDRSARQTLFRTAQEGLTNIQKHAGATQAWIFLDLAQVDSQVEQAHGERAAAPAVRLTVHDDGRGPNGGAVSDGFGLAGLAERAAQANGAVRFQASPYGGSALSVTLPLAHPAPLLDSRASQANQAE